jgi:hypothetical protein
MFVRLHISEGDFCLEERVLVTKKQMHFAWKCVTMELLKVLFKKFYLGDKIFARSNQSGSAQMCQPWVERFVEHWVWVCVAHFF